MVGDPLNEGHRYGVALQVATASNRDANVDRIVDFSVKGNDVIWLENKVFDEIQGIGKLSSDHFMKNKTGQAEDREDRIVFESDTGELYFDANGNRDGASVLFAILENRASPTHADFLVV